MIPLPSGPLSSLRPLSSSRPPSSSRPLSATLARRALSSALLSSFLLLGCGDDVAPADASSDAAALDGALDGRAVDGSLDATMLDSALDAIAADAGPDGLCGVRLTYRSTAATPTVFVAGAWNGFSEGADELLDDGTGTYETEIWLAPGLYAYKLVVNGDGSEPWRFDAANPYRVFADGVENSGLQVPDCFVPRLRVEDAVAVSSGEITATLAYERGRAGALSTVAGELRSAGATRELSSGELQVDGDTVRIQLSGLPLGKYTVSVQATDLEGRVGPNVLLPMWIEAEPFRWDDALLYVAMPDRFRNGAVGNDPAPTDASAGADFQGGDLQGIGSAIDEGYFDDLGVNAIWLTPWMVNPPGSYLAADEFNRVTGYHGYWPIDPLGVDARFGGEAALTDFVNAAHRRGIRVLMDLVVNHVHEDHPYVDDHPEWFSDGCVCGTAACDWTVRRLDCLFRPYMPDIDWTHPGAQEQLLDDAMEWMERYDLDGFRVDAVKHVQDHAVTNLRVRVRDRFEQAGTPYFLMGETAMGWDSSAGPSEGGNVENYETIRRYVGPDGLDGQFDFVLYYAAALQFLRDEPGRGMAHVDFWTRASLEQFPEPALMTPYIGSHDTPRFASLASDPGRANNQWSDYPADANQESLDRMYIAFAWMLAIPGVPLMYYGDEYGQAGGADPDNRRPMRFGSELSALERAQRDRVGALGRARAAAPGLRSRAYRTLLATEDEWAVLRGRGDERVLVLINRGPGARDLSVNVPADALAEGTELRDLLTGASARVERNRVVVRLSGRSAAYLAL